MSSVSGGRGWQLAAAIAAGMIASSPASGMANLAAPVPRIEANKKVRRGLFNRMPIFSIGYGTKGAGISMATQKRAAKKARNVKRHRAACRG